MALEFKGSKIPSLGVEIELQIIDPLTRNLSSQSHIFLEHCAQKKIEHIKAEIHLSMLEIDTGICPNVKECRSDIENRLKVVNAIAKELGLELAMSGTHPFQHWKHNKVFPSERYIAVSNKFQWLAKRATVYGLHVHVGVPDGETAIAVANGALSYIPHLIALSANSPFWQGEDTGLESCRAGIMKTFPYSGIAPYFHDWNEFSEFYQTLEAAGAVKSLKDLYWQVRPNLEFGTVEFRICDVSSTLDEIMALVAFIQNLVVWIQGDLVKNPDHREQNRKSYWLAPENHWMAERDGLEGKIILDGTGRRVSIAKDLERVIEMLTPTARTLGNYDEFIFINEIIKRGEGARRQRAVFKKTGDFKAVVDAIIHEYKTNMPVELDALGNLIDHPHYLFVK